MLRTGTLPVSIVPSASALDVFDRLEGGCEMVVKDNIVENQGELPREEMPQCK